MSCLASHELYTHQGPQRELSSDGCTGFNAWVKRDLIFQFHERIAHKPKYITHDPCHILLFMIDTNMQFNHTNSTMRSSGHSRGLFTSASDWASAQWRFVLHIPVTWSPNVNKCWVTRAYIGPGSHWPMTIQHVRVVTARFVTRFNLWLRHDLWPHNASICEPARFVTKSASICDQRYTMILESKLGRGKLVFVFTLIMYTKWYNMIIYIYELWYNAYINSGARSLMLFTLILF